MNLISFLICRVGKVHRVFLLHYFLIFVIFIFPFLNVKKAFVAAKTYRFLYASSYTAFFNTYSDDWVLENVDDMGGIIDKK